MLKSIARSALLALAFVGALAASGCAQMQQIETGAKTLYDKVVSIYSNAPKTVYVLESGYAAVQSAAVAFKQSQCQSVTGLNGKCAVIVPKLRQLDAQARAALKPVETFVRDNPTLDASSMITTAQKSIILISQEMTALGVPPTK